MGLSFHCPVCKQALPVSPMMLGKSVSCAHCREQFVLTPSCLGNNGAGQTTIGARAATPTPVAAAAQVGEPTRLAWSDGVANSTDRRLSPVLAAAVARNKKPADRNGEPPTVARFIAAEPPDTDFSLTAEGKLPELSLATPSAETPARGAGNKPRPMVVAALLASSLVSSVMLLSSDFESTDDGDVRARARRQLTEYYQHEDQPLAPYQNELRESQRARSRGDFRGEQACYRRVLEMLRSEGRTRYQGLTGTPRDDQRLEQILSDLLAPTNDDATSPTL